LKWIADPKKVMEHIIYWHNNVYPILIHPAFNEWVFFISPYVFSINRLKRTHNDLSDISFSIINKRNIVNPSRFYIGTLHLTKHIENKFLHCLVSFCGLEAYYWVEKNKSVSKLIGVGLGVDGMAGEKRVYLMFETKKPSLLALTLDWNNTIIERKRYWIDARGVTHLEGDRGERIQINVEKTGKIAQKIIEKIQGLNPYAKQLAIDVIEEGFWLDTISISPTRGIALYFD